MNNTNTKQDESYFKQDFQQLVYGGGGKYFSSKGHIYKKIFIPQITVIYKQGHK